MVFLGQAISQPEPVAVQLLVEQIVGVLPEFLGFPLPVPEAEAVEIMKAGLVSSIDLCRADYQKEVEATVSYVGKNLEEHGVGYHINGSGK